MEKRQVLYFTPVLVILLFFLVAPLILGTALVSLTNKILIFALLAMSVDIAFGYTNLWTFGHAAIFGASAYTVGLMLQHGLITNFWLLLPIGLLVAVIVSAIYIALAARTSGLYFLLITFALGQLIYSVVVHWHPVTRGTDGLWGIPYPAIGFNFTSMSYYYFTLVVVVICAILLYLMIKSPFGYSLIGIRENETRARTLGYNILLRKFIAFVISGLFAGLAGILYLYFNNGISPDAIGYSASGMAIIMVIIGGTATLWGAFVGAAVVLVFQYYISLITPERWPIYLGVVFIAAVFFARGGVYPRLTSAWKKVIGYGNIKS